MKSELDTRRAVRGKRLTEELAAQIAPYLQITGQWVRHFDPDDTEGIGRARAAGRRAGRALHVKIVTRQSDPKARQDGKVVVIVVVDEDQRT